jgi:chemotaxis protein MotA
LDILTIIGLLLAAAAIVGGQVLEGGHVSSILQPTAALIVFGGTLGAVFVQYSFRMVIDSIILAARTFLVNKHDLNDIIPDITNFARHAQREGILALEKRVKAVDDPFFKKGLQLVVDGTGLNELKDILEIEIDLGEERRISAAKVFESAGGYAPTIGILGAVLGLIQVMENLADPSMLGEGIAVAFVATVYGVASANLLWLPIAGKIKLRTRENTIQKEMILEGLVAMLSGESPRLIEDRLEGFVSRSQWKESERGYYGKAK